MSVVKIFKLCKGYIENALISSTSDFLVSKVIKTYTSLLCIFYYKHCY